ncbi:Spt4/RpoE2 zinc finger containing protein [Novymonas esmeraldas]|uniref:Spt4/RpoE2 zinc finger containing protein n=1 Tax=Novymonas esmeraldas TaxID=1808958 RepID=A0AAW0ERF4_9TRYP
MQTSQRPRAAPVVADGAVATEAPPQLPLTDGRHYACRRCRRILSEAQWYTEGCGECSSTMGVPDRDSLLDFATPHFHNFIGLIAPEQSWVARLIMKSREPTNGIFAEALSDDELSDEEDAVAEPYETDEGDGTAADAHHPATETTD